MLLYPLYQNYAYTIKPFIPDQAFWLFSRPFDQILSAIKINFALFIINPMLQCKIAQAYSTILLQAGLRNTGYWSGCMHFKWF